MSKRTQAATRGKVKRATQLLRWLAFMCSEDPAAAALDGIDDVELLGSGRAAWLPVDRGHNPVPELDVLVATGVLEAGGLRPSVLVIKANRLQCRESFRLTRKGRRVVARLRSAPPAEVADLLVEILRLSPAEADVVREELASTRDEDDASREASRS